jgi:protease-4
VAAADDAGMSDYEVVRMDAPQLSVLGQLGLDAGDAGDTTTEQTFEYSGVDTVQYLMLHGTIQTDAAGNDTEVTANAGA